MAKEMEVFKNARPAAAFAALGGEQKESLAEGIGSSYGVIGYKGSRWTLRYRGEKHAFVRADDGSPMSYLDVIILRQGHSKSKSYYLSKEEGGGYDPEASEGKRPVCASLDGVTPDPDVLEKQSDQCAVCRRNVWKTFKDGRKGRECTDYKRLAVLIMPSLTNALLGSPLLEPVFLRIPPASLNDLAVFGENMAGQGWHFSTFITRVSFDPEQSYPKLIFKPLQALTDAEAPVVLPLREDPMALRITGEDQHVEAVARIAQVKPPLQVAAPVAAPAAPPAAAVTAPKATTPTVTTASPSEPEGPVDTGFGLVGKPTAVVPGAPGGGPAATAQTVEDTGEATESDAALDERIKSLLAS